MTGIARALQTKNYDVWIKRSDGSRVLPTDRVRRFIQRGGAPSGIAPSALGRGNPSSISFRRGQGDAWEILNGVQFAGRSSGHHELDLAIVPEAVANSLRNRPGGGIPLGRPRVAVECKYVTALGSPDEMRALIARLYDLTLLWAHHPHLPPQRVPQAIHPDPPAGPLHEPANTYWSENRRTLNVLARKTGFSPGAAALTGYYRIEPHARITAGAANAAALFNDVADWISNQGY